MSLGKGIQQACLKQTLSCSQLLGETIWLLTDARLSSAMTWKTVYSLTYITRALCGHRHQKYFNWVANKIGGTFGWNQNLLQLLWIAWCWILLAYGEIHYHGSTPANSKAIEGIRVVVRSLLEYSCTFGRYPIASK
jgi:hypothetical protein